MQADVARELIKAGVAGHGFHQRRVEGTLAMGSDTDRRYVVGESDGRRVRDMIVQARSLRELWHLRTDVFRVVALHRGQTEAEMRMEALDAHFPIRASRRADETRNAKVTTW